MNITHHKNGEIKTLVEEAPYNPGYEDAGFKPKVLNNEPVAWIDKDGNIFYTDGIAHTLPLYTHPAELTDAETALRSLYEAIIRYENLSLFPDKYAIESCEYQLHDAKEKARAILRKAQKK